MQMEHQTLLRCRLIPFIRKLALHRGANSPCRECDIAGP